MMLSTHRAILHHLMDAKRDRMIVKLSRHPVAVLQPSAVVSMCKQLVAEFPADSSVVLVEPPAVMYDVVRVRHATPLFVRDHMQRLLSSVRSQLGAPFPTLVPMAAKMSPESSGAVLESWPQWFQSIYDGIISVIEAQDDPQTEQNVKVIVWEEERCCATEETTSSDQGWDLRCARLSYAVYFIHSSYPTREWYTNGGASVALLYNASRCNPNAKVVQSTLRSRASQQQAALGVFESLLVHPRGDGYKVTEGSRSNFLVFTRDGTVMSSMESEILIGVTLLAVRRCVQQVLGKDIVFKTLAVSDLAEARSIVMLGTSVGVLPLSKVVVYTTLEERALFQEAMSLPCSSDSAPSVEEALGANGELIGQISKASHADTVVQQILNAYEKEAYRQ